MARKPESSEPIEEKTPERLAINAVSNVESRNDADCILPPRIREFSQTFFSPKENWQSAKRVLAFSALSLGGLLVVGFRIVKGVLSFAKDSLSGKMGFGRGQEIIGSIFEPKKGKKE